MLSDNFYWLSNQASDFTSLKDLAPVSLETSATYVLEEGRYRIKVAVTNDAGPVAFWVRLQLLKPGSGETS